MHRAFTEREQSEKRVCTEQEWPPADSRGGNRKKTDGVVVVVIGGGGGGRLLSSFYDSLHAAICKHGI